MDPVSRLNRFFQSSSLNPVLADILPQIIVVAAVFILALLIWRIAIKIVFRLIKKIVQKSKSSWAKELLKRRFFYRASWMASALIIRVLITAWLDDNLLILLTRVADAVIIVSAALSVTDLLSFGNAIYTRREESKRRPVKGLIQAVQVIVIVAAVIILFSSLTGRPVSGLMTGLGAISAVLMLVFKDPLMGLVSGFQISSNDMVRLGDWIEMPSYGADGDVVDISLLNVTVRNWDKTYVTFPIQALTTGGFKNWRGMSDSGGRRIKRSVSIDMSSIHFLGDSEIKKLESVSLLKDYLEQRSEEIRNHNSGSGADRNASLVNGRALTNIGVFRTYAKNYILAHPKTHSDMTLLVRQLQSGPQGLPLEIYVFSADQNWVGFEDLQSDIFDHLLAVLPEFGLKAFQNPTGADVRSLQSRVFSDKE